VLLGEFGRAHGLKGEVRLKSFTADPAAIASYGPLLTTGGQAVVLTGLRPAPGSAPDLLIAGVDGVTTREAAEALNRIRLFVARGKLPPPDDEDEFFLADLIGLTAVAPGGRVLGTVVAVPNFGGGDLLEIAPAGPGPSAFLPFTKAFVPLVDMAGRRVVVDAPDDLFEPAKSEPGDAA
jgi:16S rRNA processing protein RimM